MTSVFYFTVLSTTYAPIAYTILLQRKLVTVMMMMMMVMMTMMTTRLTTMMTTDVNIFLLDPSHVGCVPPNHHIQVKTFPFFNADNK
jgi:hypothetical protein